MTTIEELERRLTKSATPWQDDEIARAAIALCRSLQQQLAERDARCRRLSRLLCVLDTALLDSDDEGLYARSEYHAEVAELKAATAPSGEMK